MSSEKRFMAEDAIGGVQRVLSLFPRTYRQEHEAELLDYLVEGGAGRGGVQVADRRDLLRAAAREWLLAPLGSSAVQRRDGIRSLMVVLPAILLLPAVAGVGSAAGTLFASGDLSFAVTSSPLSPAWLVWLVAMISAAFGALGVARVLGTVAAVVGWGALTWLCLLGEERSALVAVGWVLGLTAYGVVVGERGRWSRPLTGLTWGRAALLFIAAVLSAPAAWLLQTVLFGTARSGGRILAGSLPAAGPLIVAAVAGVVALFVFRATRQAAPLVLGIASGLALGRADALGILPLDTVDLGHVLLVVVVSIASTCGARWVVNRIDEAGHSRAELSDAYARVVS